MKLSDKQHKFLIGGIAILIVATYIVLDRTGDPGTDSNGEAPKREALNPVMQGMSGTSDNLGVRPDGSFGAVSRFWHFFSPHDEHLCDVTWDYGHYVRHRYPTVSGSNISTLIHRGYSPLMVPSKRDYDWLVNPPGEVMF